MIFLKVNDQVSCPQTTGKIIVTYIYTLFTFLDSSQ